MNTRSISLRCLIAWVMSTVALCWFAVGRAATPTSPSQMDPEGNEALAERCAIYKAQHAACECRTRAEMAAAYSAGMISLTSRQLVGFRNKWQNAELQAFTGHPLLNDGKRWMDSFLKQYVGHRELRITALHLDANSRRVLVLPEPSMTGSMTEHRTGPLQFLVAAELFDQYICTSNMMARAVRSPSAGGARLFAAHQLEGLFVDPDVSTQIQLVQWAKLARADRSAIADLQDFDPQVYEKAVVGRALFTSSVEEAMEAWSTAGVTEAITLQGLGLAGVKRKQPAEETRNEIRLLLADFDRSGEEPSLNVERLSPESRDLLQALVGRSRQAAEDASVDERVVSAAVKEQAGQHPFLELPIETSNY